MIVQLPLGISPLYPYWAGQTRIALNSAAPLIAKALCQTTLTIEANTETDFPQAYTVRLDDLLTTIYFDVEDTGLHRSGQVIRDGGDGEACAAHYAHLTGQAL